MRLRVNLIKSTNETHKSTDTRACVNLIRDKDRYQLLGQMQMIAEWSPSMSMIPQYNHRQ